MNVLAAFKEIIVAAQLPKDHIAIRIAKNYSIPLSVAQDRWRYAKNAAKRQNREGDFFFALSVVDKLRTTPIRPPQGGALAIPRRELRLLRKPSSVPLQRRQVKPRKNEVSSIDVFKRPKKRRLLMDLEHIRERMKRRRARVHTTSSQRYRRKLARALWQRKNASALRRRQQFLKSYWAVHGPH